MIDCSTYAGMLLDFERIQTFIKVIDTSVHSGDTVVDVGSGLGTYAMAAARAGARKVFAVEKGLIYPLLKTIIQQNSFSDIVEPVKANITDNLHSVDLNADSLLGEPHEMWSFPLDAPLSSFTSEMSWKIDGKAECNGIALWFELDFGAGIVLSNAPGTRVTSWGQTLFPLSQICLASNSYEVSLKFEFYPDDNIWNWYALWLDNKEAHSTAFSVPLDKRAFLNWDIPLNTRPNLEGEITKLVLLSAENGMTPKQIFNFLEKNIGNRLTPVEMKTLIRSVICQYF